MKHSESIIAIKNDFFSAERGFKQGVTHVNMEEMANQVIPFTVAACRRVLEGSPEYRQVLPYILFMRVDEDGQHRFFAYQRGKGIGENRLLGKVSVGIGGHVDIADVIHVDSVVNVKLTASNSAIREIREEVEFTGPDVELNLHEIGILLDSSDEVGRVHAGFVMCVGLEKNVEIKCREEELTTLGFFTAKELLEGDYPLENWSRIALEHFIEINLA